MTKTEAVQKQFQKALKRLQEVLSLKESTLVRDAGIQRFEFTFDLSWKFLKSLLQEKAGIISSSPKEVFRSAYRAGYIAYEETWLKMTDDRNESSHSYNEEFSKELFKRLPIYLEKFEELEKMVILGDE